MGREQGVIQTSKHGVSFEETSTAFGGSWSLTIPDPVNSQVEERTIVLPAGGDDPFPSLGWPAAGGWRRCRNIP